jgi:hypothetical protein
LSSKFKSIGKVITGKGNGSIRYMGRDTSGGSRNMGGGGDFEGGEEERLNADGVPLYWVGYRDDSRYVLKLQPRQILLLPLVFGAEDYSNPGGVGTSEGVGRGEDTGVGNGEGRTSENIPAQAPAPAPDGNYNHTVNRSVH